MPRRIDIMNGQRIALTLVAVTLAATVLLAACVEKVSPCDKFDVFAEIYAPSCPAVETWATSCASNLAEILPEDRQDFDWCVDCYVLADDDMERNCMQAPLGNSCPALLNRTLSTPDASCLWPVPVQ